MNDLHARVVHRVRELARVQRVPLSHLPDRAGVSRSHFWEVLAGRASPTLEWVEKIAQALQVDPEQLIVRRGR